MTLLKKLHQQGKLLISCMASILTMEVKGRLTTCLTIGFRCLPNYGNDVRMQYNRILSEIAGSNLLGYLVKQIAKRDIKVVKYGDISADVLEANYSLS